MRPRERSLETDHGNHGTTLIESLLAISILLGALAGTYALSSRPGAIASAALELPALVDAARELAAVSGDGATIVFFPNAASFDVTIYSGRPDSSGSFNAANPARSSRIAGLLSTSLGGNSPAAGTPSSFAVFVSTAGTVSYALWTPSQGPIAQEPACTSPLYLAIGSTAQPAVHPTGATGAAWFELACSDARLTPQP
jgi:hypothetical protein